MRRQMILGSGALLTIMIVCLPLYSYQDYSGRGTRATALADCFVSLSDNSWAASHNPAGLSRITSFDASVFFVQEQFGLPELRTVAASMAFPMDIVNVSGEIDQFGFDLYKQTTIRVGLAGVIEKNLSAGCAVSFDRMFFDRYGTQSSTTFDIGILATLQENVNIGFAFRNLFGARVGNSQERAPQVFLLGTSYSMIADLILLLEVEKDLRFDAMVKGGVEQTILDFLKLRVGVSNNPDKLSAGFALLYGGMEFGYAGYSHNDLGWTHQIELRFLAK